MVYYCRRKQRRIKTMMTKKELHGEFRLLTKSVLEDSRIDADEARVIKRWMEKRRAGDAFGFFIENPNGFLGDGRVGRWGSTKVIEALGSVLRQLRAFE